MLIVMIALAVRDLNRFGQPISFSSYLDKSFRLFQKVTKLTMANKDQILVQRFIQTDGSRTGINHHEQTADQPYVF